QRNRIKRQIKESFRHSCGQSVYPMQPSVTKSPAVDFVVVAKIAAANAQNKELRQELDRLWLKASKKCEAS
ncbi:MAG: ribonuclease P protein component, partial [Gammaproteobacteria bacterium]